MQNKTTQTNQSNNQPHSSYWLSEQVSNDFELDAYSLAATKRAISNFVNIVAGEGIDVKYSSGKMSYTDGKTVVISSKFSKPVDFDVAVGLSLHEASHVLLSNFDTIANLRNSIEKLVDYNELYQKATKAGIKSLAAFEQYVKNILNYIEDRRIDAFIYKSSPGYRNYYHSMYDMYFNSKEIEKALKQGELMCDETTESYMFRLINLHSNHADLDALQSLRRINELIDINNITRLNSTFDALRVAVKVADVIFTSCEDLSFLNGSSNKSESDSQNSSGDDNENADDDYDLGEQGDYSDDSPESKKRNNDADDDVVDDDDGIGTSGRDIDSPGSNDSASTDSESDGESEDTESEDGSDSGGDSDAEGGDIVSNPKLEKLRKALEKQKNFLNGDIKKKKISAKLNETVDAIKNSDIDIENATYDGVKIKTLIVNGISNELLKSDAFPISNSIAYDNNAFEEAVERGATMGKILGKKIQTRSEDRTTIFNRQLSGKIDRRMLSSAGAGNEHLFYTSEVSKFKNVNIHLSIDASSSMYASSLTSLLSGKTVKSIDTTSSWYNSLVIAVALAKAAEMIPNFNIQISFRTTTKYEGVEVPYVAVAYDSRKDKFTKIKTIFPKLYPNGTTPESLCYESIINKLVPASAETESYFITITDGAPYFNDKRINYGGKPAVTHIKKSMKAINDKGIKTMAYFVHGGHYMNETIKLFTSGYGSDGSVLDINNMNSIIKTINGLLLKK
jgi:hypothetical protein